MAEIIEIFDKKINDNEFEKAIIKYNETKNESDLEDAKLYYYKKRLEYEIMIQREEDYEWKQNWGMGFWFVLNEYKGNQVISDFIAKCMLNEIYEENNEFNLKDYLHSKFKSKNDLLKIGIKQYIINSLMSYDECLSGYLQVHINLISDIEFKIKDIINKWDSYQSKQIDPEELLDVIDEFVSYTNDCDYDTIDLAHYLKYELGIDCLKAYGDLRDESGISEEEYYKFTFGNPTLKQQKLLMSFKKVIIDYLRDNKFPDSYMQTEEDKKNKLLINRKLNI